MTGLVLALLGIPALGSLLLVLAPHSAERWARWFGVLVTGVTLAAAVALAIGFDHADPARMQGETDIAWIDPLDVRFHLGVDGVSLPLLLLTALLTFLCAVYLLRWCRRPAARALVALLLVLEVGMLGTFLALDLVLFFVFFEIVLVPMWFVIAGWGDRRGARCRDKFILYTLLGSAFMLLGFILVWAKTGTFDMVVLAESGGAGMSRVGAADRPACGGHRLRRQGADVAAAHLAAGRAHRSADGRLGAAGRGAAEDGHVRLRADRRCRCSRTRRRRWRPYLGALAVVGILYGSLACLPQRDLKRLIAYSSVGHMGFVLLGIATLTDAASTARCSPTSPTA